MCRKSINTTLNNDLYIKIQILALQLSNKDGNKINANDLIEEGLRYVLNKYQTK